MNDNSNRISNHKYLPDQKVSDNIKKTKDWYIPTINYVIDRAINSDNKETVLTHMRAANGDVDTSTIQYVLKPYGAKTSTQTEIDSLNKTARFPHTLRDIDIITPIKERYLGEYLKQYHNYQVFINDADVLFIRNQELTQALTTALYAEFEKLVKAKEENKDTESLDVEKFTEEFIDEWIDERAIKAQEQLELVNTLTESIIKYIEGFFYWWATEQVYSYRTIVNDELVKEIIPPWEYYRVDSGNVFVEDDDMGVRKYKLSLNQIKERFNEDLTDKDFKDLEVLTTTDLVDSTSNEIKELLYSRTINVNEFKNILPDTVYSKYQRGDYTGEITIYHAVWKTQKKVQILTYQVPDSDEIDTMLVNKDYKLQPEIGDIELKSDWINEFMEGYRFGGEFEGVYIPARPLEVQRQLIGNMSRCKSCYNGITGIIPFNKIKPIPIRLAPYQVLIKLYNYQREKAIAKFKSFNIMPESILTDSADMSLEERFQYAAIDDILPVDISTLEPNEINVIRSLYNSGAERFITILSELIRDIELQAKDAANMNDQRYGDIGAREGKATTEYAISKATTGSIALYEMFNKFRERDYVADLDWSKAAWKDGKQGAYIDPETNKPVYVNIDNTSELSSNVGVSIKNSAVEEEKLQMLKDLAFSAAQNGDLSVAAEAIDSSSVSKLKQLIKDYEQSKKEYEQSIEDARNRMAAEVEKSRREGEAEARQHELDKLTLTENNENIRHLEELQFKYDELETKMEQGGDNNINDSYEKELTAAKDKINNLLTKLEMEKAKAKQQSATASK